MDRTAEIILREENHRFSADEKGSASGIIRMRRESGRVEITMETANLRLLDQEKYTYRLMMLGLKDGRSIHRTLADFQAARDGSASGRWVLPSGDADGRCNAVEDFFVFMIVAASKHDRREQYHPVLKGDWDRKWQRLYNSYYTEFVRIMAFRLISGKEQFRKIHVFDGSWFSDNWRVVENAEMLPVASADAEEVLKESGHFIFSFNDEYLLLGIPGSRENGGRPDGGESGFTLWQPAKGSEEHGYWLTAIRRETGEIVGI